MADDFWKDEDVVFTYTDEEAVEDGVIIPVSFGSISRITRAVFDDFDKGRFDDAGFDRFMNEAMKILEGKMKARKDWFYSGLIERRKYFFVENGSGFTLMKPEDY